jgi:hypothetical protein
VRALAWLFLTVTATSFEASADPVPLDAAMICTPAAGPGRVRCDAEVRAPADARLTWADVVILEAPPSVTPLKGRLAPSDATESRDASWRWAFAVVAKAHGKGELKARVRAVICRGDACASVTRDVSTIVSAGD